MLPLCYTNPFVLAVTVRMRIPRSPEQVPGNHGQLFWSCYQHDIADTNKLLWPVLDTCCGSFFANPRQLHVTNVVVVVWNTQSFSPLNAYGEVDPVVYLSLTPYP